MTAEDEEHRLLEESEPHSITSLHLDNFVSELESQTLFVAHAVQLEL